MEYQGIESQIKIPPKYTIAGGLKLANSMIGDKILNSIYIQ